MDTTSPSCTRADAAPDIVIGIGEPKKTTADALTALTEQTRIPFIQNVDTEAYDKAWGLFSF